MSYIDDSLMSGERVAHRARLHWIVFLWPCIFLGIALLLFGKGTDYSGARGVFFVLALVLGVASFINYFTSEFGVTDKRVLAKFGFIRRTSIETFLTKVESIQVVQGISGRILNYGTVVVSGTGGSREPFRKISAPLEFRRKVQEQIEAAYSHPS